MSLVNWKNLLPETVSNTIRVDYSYLAIPHDPSELDQDVARIRLDQGYIVDVEWCDDSEEYIVTLSKYAYEYDIIRHRFRDVNEVVDVIRQWATEYAQDWHAISHATDTIADGISLVA